MSPSSSKLSLSGSHYLRAKVKHFSLVHKTIKLHPDILPHLISHCSNRSPLPSEPLELMFTPDLAHLIPAD